MTGPPEKLPVTLGDAAVAYFHVLTAEGQALSLRDGMLVLTAALDPTNGVIAILPALLPNVCVLVAPDGRSFSVAADADHGIAASALLVRSEVRVAVLLRYAWGWSFLMADAQNLRFDGSGETKNAVFVLRALGGQHVSATALALGEELGVAVGSNGQFRALLAAVRDGTCRPELAGRLVRVLPRSELAELGRSLLTSAADRESLIRLLPNDVWLQSYLPSLATWNISRSIEASEMQVSGPEDETPLLEGLPGLKLVSTGLALHCLARRAVQARRGACVLACARNEGVYILDWIAYHLSVGFEHIFLYTNDNDDGSDELLELLAGHGAITWIRNRCGSEMSPQSKCYAHALRMLPQILDYAWVAVLDLDEYVGFEPSRYSNFRDFLAQIELYFTDAVALCWLLHAARPGDRWSTESTLTRFPCRENNVNRHVKSVFRPNKFWFALPHEPFSSLGEPFVFRSPDGGLHHHEGVHDRAASFSGVRIADRAWIGHYMMRSAEEALWKWSRGLGDRTAHNPERHYPLEFIARTFLNLARPEHLVHDQRIIKCAHGQAGVMDQLFALPGVATCDAEIKARFAERLAANTRAFLESPLPEGASGQLIAFRELIEFIT